MNLPLQLDRSAQIPLQDQLFEQLRQMILSGRLKPNTRVIATRFLAEQAGVSRRTVLLAYERLISEGYLETRPAIGTFVSPTQPGDSRPLAAANANSDVPRHAMRHPAKIQPAKKSRSSHAGVLFDFGPQAKSAFDALPRKVWLRRMREALDADPEIFVRPAPTAGIEPLRRIIAEYLAATRGILASPEQIVIVSGRRHACSLVAHLFQRHGDRVVIEAPSDDVIAEFFRIRSGNVVSVPVDEHGLDVDRLPLGPAALAYVTPARQNPLGGTLPLPRCVALIEWARATGAYIIEDGCDSEFRYHGAAHPPLATIDPHGLVFYVGSFAPVLGEGLCLGYLLVPPEFAASLVAIKSMGMEAGQCFEQMVVASLLAGGEYDHHLRRLRKNYLERRDSLVLELKAHFGEVSLIGTGTGSQLTWVLPEHFPAVSSVCEAAIKSGVRLRGVVDQAWNRSPYYEKALMLNYAALTPEQIREGIAVLARVLKDMSLARHSALWLDSSSTSS